MRIAIVTETWKPAINGVVTRLSVAVDALVAAGHEVLVIAPSLGAGDAAVPPQAGVTLHRIPSFRIGWVYGGQPWGWPLPRVRRLLARFRPDVVHVVDPFVLGVAGVIAARRLRLPLVTSFHTDIAAYAASYHLAWSRPIIWRIRRALHNSGRLTLVTSHHAAELVASHGIRDAQLWRRGVDLERFRPRGGGRPPDRVPTAVYVGRLADEKHLTALLPLARSATVRLVLVGDGPDRPRLEREFAGTGTVFTGTLTGDALVDAYAAADVFVFPSTTETLGLVLIEALACGLPIVAAASPASRELLHGHVAARLVAPGHDDDFTAAVASVLAVPAAQRVDEARAAAEGWGWPAATAQLIERYRQVAAAAHPTHPAACGSTATGNTATRSTATAAGRSAPAAARPADRGDHGVVTPPRCRRARESTRGGSTCLRPAPACCWPRTTPSWAPSSPRCWPRPTTSS